MAAFANGVANLFAMDRHFQRRAIRTSFAKGLVERLVTVVLAFFMLLLPVIHLAILHLVVVTAELGPNNLQFSRSGRSYQVWQSIL